MSGPSCIRNSTIRFVNLADGRVRCLAEAEAIAPIPQGVAKPVNDLSRGATADTIVEVSVLTILQAG